MKKTGILMAWLIAVPLVAQSLTPKQIIEKIDANERVESSKSTVRQTIITSGGDKRTLEMNGFSKDRNDKQVMVYTGPKRVKGDKILMLNDGDDIWFYTPKTDRVRHLASHARRQKVQGSDFSYEDMSSGSLEEDYTYTLLEDEEIDDRLCFHLELIPTEKGPSYKKLDLWADKEQFVSRRIDYYDEDGLLKRLTLTNVQNVNGHWYAMDLRMVNLREGGETVMETETIEINITLDDELFTTNALKKRRN